jgi:hypothetical protein
VQGAARAPGDVVLGAADEAVDDRLDVAGLLGAVVAVDEGVHLLSGHGAAPILM